MVFTPRVQQYLSIYKLKGLWVIFRFHLLFNLHSICSVKNKTAIGWCICSIKNKTAIGW